MSADDPASLSRSRRTELLLAAVELLRSATPLELTPAAVAASAGASEQEIADHFGPFMELVHEAVVVRYASYIDDAITSISLLLRSARSFEEFRQSMMQVMRYSQSAIRRPLRLANAEALGHARDDARYAALLAREQQRLTDALADLVVFAQQKGWVRSVLDPHAVAVLIQAYSIGRIVDDVAARPLEGDVWVDLIDEIVDRVILSVV